MTETTPDKELRDAFSTTVDKYRELIANGTPYVWMLKLSIDDFSLLERLIVRSIDSHQGTHAHLISDTFAPYIVIYIAEWYKRVYNGRETGDDIPVVNLDTNERIKLYELCGIDKNVFAYTIGENTGKPSTRWKESMEVLGGLPVRYELARDDTSALVNLCKIYHGEDDDLDGMADRERAYAYQQSLIQRHSLYHFIECILSDQMPFADADLQDKNSDISLFFSRVKSADWLSRQDKFEFEWIVTYNGARNFMTRKIKVRLKPEAIGGKYRNYIGYDRLREQWNIPNPESVGQLMFDLRYKDRGAVIKEASFRDPILTYYNTGDETAGFLLAGIREETHIPTAPFTEIDLVLRYDGHSRIVQSLTCKGYVQVYKIAKSINEWSSVKRPQAPTSLIFSSKYVLKDTQRQEQIVCLPFIDGENVSDPWYWCPIYDVVTLVDDHGRDVTPSFYNRNGYYQVLTKKYLNTIKYQDNLYVTYKYIEIGNCDDEDIFEDEDYSTDTLPLLFGRDGLQVRFYKSMASADWSPIESYDLDFMNDKGDYITWDEEHQPTQGKVRIRITVKGTVCKKVVYYVPFVATSETQEPIWRDFERQKICFGISGQPDVQDSFDQDFKKSDDTIQIELGNRYSYALIDVYRPIKLRELYQEGKLVSYHSPDDIIEIPLLLSDQFAIRDFNENGVDEYTLSALHSPYYSFPNFGNYTDPSDSLFLKELDIEKVDERFKLEYLKIYFTKALEKKGNLFQWDYKDEFRSVHEGETPDIQSGIIFQSLCGPKTPRHYAMPEFRYDNDGWDFDTDDTTDEADALSCFSVASHHLVYYSIFKPLREAVNEVRQVEKILLPLIKCRQTYPGGVLIESDIDSLYRFANEFHFDWMLLRRDRMIEAIEKASSSEDEVNWYRQQVERFFRLSPKITDESERRSLEHFMQRYWTFDDYSTTEPIAVKSLRYILGDNYNILARNETWEDFLREYDSCRYKFSEMSRVLCKIDKN